MGKLPDRRLHILICVLLILTVALVYYQSLGHGFVNYDDPSYVVKNVHVQSGLTLSGLAWAFLSVHEANWHPLVWLSLMADHSLFGLQPYGYHLTSIILHALNTVLLFLLLRRMTGSVWRSAFVAALFGAHPLHVESVAWVTERKDVLSALFWLIGTWAYVRYVERPDVKRYLVVALALALGLMSKPLLVTFPVALLLLDYWPLGRMAKSISVLRARAWRPLVVEKLPLFALAAASSAVTFYAQRAGGAVAPFERIPFGLRIENALVSYVMYLVKTVWPSGLAIVYPHPTAGLPLWQVLGAGLVLACLTLLAVRAARRRPYVLTGWLWYLIILVPMIGVVQVGVQAMADRYTYVPLIGIFVIVAWGIPDAVARLNESLRRGILVASSVAAVAALTVVAWVQVGHWRDTVTLFGHALSCTSRNYIAHSNMAFGLGEQGKTDEAIYHCRQALRFNLNFVEAHNDLGAFMMRKGRLGDAQAHYRQALRLNPRFAEGYYNLGVLLASQGKNREAAREYRRATAIKPDYVEALVNLANILAAQGQTEQAISYYNAALRLKQDGMIYRNIGNLFARSGRLDEAVESFDKALAMRPNDPRSHSDLGAALVARGDVEAGIEHYQQALRLKPDYVEAHLNLGTALGMRNKLKESIYHLREAARLAPKKPAAHMNLAVALYYRGDYAAAWREVHACRALGVKLDPRFVKDLSAKAPDPRR